MKKLLVAVVAFTAMMLAGTDKAAAQSKMGYFDLEYVVGLMPGIGKVDTTLAEFERDSIGAEYEFRVSEFNRLDSTLRADSAAMPAHLYQQRKQEMIQRFYVLQNWQQYSQQVMQSKQQELLAPYYEKVIKAFRQVVDEGKYGYVFKRESVYLAPPADDLIPLVAKKLGIKVPVDPNAPVSEPAEKPAAKPAAKPKQ